MNSASDKFKDVRELQALARSVDIEPARPTSKVGRAAQLEVIDLLSRWSAAGLALITGSSIYLAITAGRNYPSRAAAWALLVLAALWICRRMQSQFRAGTSAAARPFRWRASFTAALLVLFIAFASAPILLTPVDAAAGLSFQVSAITLFTLLGASGFLVSYRKAALAAACPGILLPIFAALRNSDPLYALGIAAFGVIAIAALTGVNSMVIGNLRQKHPRTKWERGEVVTDAKSVATANTEQKSA